MGDEYFISTEAAAEVAKLLTEALKQGSPFDDELLAEALEALEWADRIVIGEDDDEDAED